MLLGIWIASLTVGLDVVFELKAYDLIGAACVFHFRRPLSVALRRSKGSSRWLVWFLGAMVFGTIITIVQSENTIQVAVVIIRLYRAASYVCLFLILGVVFKFTGKAFAMIRVVFFAALFQALLIILQWVGVLPILWPEAERYYRQLVPTGTLGLHHLNSVLFMVVGITAGVTLAFREKGSRSLPHVLLYSGSFVLMISAMLIGEALSGLVALCVVSISMLRRRHGILVVILVAGLAIGLRGFTEIDLFSQADRIWEDRIRSRDVMPSAGVEFLYEVDRRRPRLWQDTVTALAARPGLLVTGIGFQNFRALRILATGAHNQYLTVLVELGVGGFAVYCAWLWSLLRSFRRTRRGGTEWMAVPLLSAQSCLSALLVLGLFNEVLYPVRALPGFLGFALAYFGVMVAIQGLARSEQILGGPISGRGSRSTGVVPSRIPVAGGEPLTLKGHV